jgi:hypothetical protein
LDGRAKEEKAPGESERGIANEGPICGNCQSKRLLVVGDWCYSRKLLKKKKKKKQKKKTMTMEQLGYL